MTTDRRRLALLIGLNLALLALWAWAQLETQTIRMVVAGSEVRAYVDGRFVVAAPSPYSDGGVDVYLGDGGYVQNDPGLPEPVRALSRQLRESAWGSVTVRSPDGRLLAGPSQTFGLAMILPLADGLRSPPSIPDPGVPEYVVEATLIRPREPAGIIVQNLGGEGILFFFRPEHRDTGLWIGSEHGPDRLLQPGPYRFYQKATAAALQDITRLLLSAYPLALAVLALALGARVVGQSRRRPGRLAVCPSPASPLRHDSSDHPIGRGLVSPGPMPTAGDNPPSYVPGRDHLLAGGEPGSSGRREPGAASYSQQADETGTRPSGRHRMLAVWGVVASLSLATLALTGYVAYVILERLPHVQDSVAYLFQAKVFARGQLWAPLPELPEFFEHEFVVMRDGRWFAKYPPGFPAILALGVLAGVPWLVNPLCAAASVVLLFLIGRRLGGVATGLVSALLALTSPFLIFLSGSFMSHSAGLLLALAFTWLFLRREHGWSALAAGAALGLGMLVRPWTMAVIAAPFAVVALADLVRLKSLAFRRYAMMAGGFLPFLAVWLAYNAILTGSPLSNTMELWWKFDRVGFGADHGPFGFWPADGFANTSRNLGLLLTHLYGWPPFATLFFVTLPFVGGRARRTDPLLLAGFLALVAGYFVWWADGVMYGPRFLYEGIGFLFILTGRGVVELEAITRGTLERLGLRARWPGPAVATAALGFLVALNATLYLPAQFALHRGYNYVNRGSLNAVEAAGIHNALVFTDTGGPYDWWWYGMVFSANSPFLDSDVIFARDRGPAENARLLAAFPDREPFLLSKTTLRPLGRSD